ncbi:MAG: type IV pilin accessory protein [Betaproteobacteria bacterium]|nr:type IV pilin accessory protein [Betaproteobacteria bacterium]
MNRWKASGIHLTISFVIACTVTLLICFILYPGFYFYLSGGFKLLFLIVGVDVFIGPLLTLIVYKKGKKNLIFDLSVIVLLQMVALVYGVHTMWVARPVYNVFEVDRFVVVTPVSINGESLAKAKPEYQKLPWNGPKLVGAEKPTNPDEQYKMVISGLSGADIETYPQYYVPFESQKAQVAKKAKPLSELRGKTPETAKLIDDFLRSQKGKEEDYRYLPMKGFSPDFMVMVVTLDGTPVTGLAIDPW